MSAGSTAPAAAGEAGATLSWKVWPWRRFAPAAPIIALIFAALFVWAIVGARDWLWAVLVLWAAAVVLGDLAFPLRYLLDEEGIERHGPLGARRFGWSAFDRYETLSGGRIIALRFAGSGLARLLRRQLSVFVPDDETRAAAERTIARRLPAAGERR